MTNIVTLGYNGELSIASIAGGAEAHRMWPCGVEGQSMRPSGTPSTAGARRSLRKRAVLMNRDHGTWGINRDMYAIDTVA